MRTSLAAGAGLATLVYAGIVAYGRVLYGAHFMTDVVFSAGLGIALAPLCVELSAWAVRWLDSRGRRREDATPPAP